MLIADSQIHLSTFGQSQPTRRGQLSGGVYAEEILKEMDGAGVGRAILATATWDPDSGGQCLDAAIKYPDRFKVFGRLRVDEPGCQAQVPGWKQQPGMLGMRVNMRKMLNEDARAGDADFWLWAALEKADVPTMLLASEHFWTVKPIAERHPGLRLAICHLGVDLTKGNDEEAFAHMDQLLALAALPNVAVKWSGLQTYSSEAYPFPRIHPFLRRIHDAFGPRRIFWGTDLTRASYWDLPGRPRHCSYRQAVTMVTEELSWLSQTDKALIMGQALCDWAGWPQ